MTDGSNPDLKQMFGLAKPIQWDDKQKEAIARCCDIKQRVVAVTGGAGTGKTALIREVAKQLSAAGYTTQASTPTGKAARRVQELTGLQAMTNHRMLGYGTPTEHEETDEKTGRKTVKHLSTGPRYDRLRPLPYDTILCDEYAMVNEEINRNILSALKAGGRICVFGDANQLKPIEEDKRLEGAPSPFMRALEKFDGIVLDTIHRQKEGSGIAANGALILEGRMPKKTHDFDMQITSEPVKHMQEFVATNLDAGIDYSTVDHQIITCMNKSWIGTKKLNLLLQANFWHRDRPYLELPRYKYGSIDEQAPIRVQVGSKVVYTANTYDLGDEQSVFNGETGIVVSVNHDDGSLDVDLGDRVVTIPPILITVRPDGSVIEGDPRRNIDHAYALTTHKCQGSEYKHVCYVINKSTLWVQSRRNMYTAITRAREKCTLLTDMVSLAKSTKFPG